jgi:hypothetical protein
MDNNAFTGFRKAYTASGERKIVSPLKILFSPIPFPDPERAFTRLIPQRDA